MEQLTRDIPESLQKFISEDTPADIADRYASLPEIAASTHFGPFDDDLVVVDTETTGFSFNHDELIQIAAARVSGGEIVDWCVTFVDPGKNIPDEIIHLTGISNEDVAGAPSPNEALAQLAAFVGSSYVVAHNVEFDKTFTTKHPGGYPLLENTWIDSLDLSRIALPRMKSHRLLDLVRAFDCPLSTHRADADVEATCAVLRILLSAIQMMPHELVAKIASLATVEQWPTSVVFKYMASRETICEDADQQMFSLRKLRRLRQTDFQSEAKIDADDLASDPKRTLVFPSKDEIASSFASDGLVGGMYAAYEPRAEQKSMSEAVRAAFETSSNLVVEAGTGVGKSMAYLIPSVYTAKRNGVAVGVATKTNALLDQLVYNELPRLKEQIPDLTYAALKGFSHYPCLRKIEQIAEDGAHMRTIMGKEVSQAPSIAAMLSFVEQTAYGDMGVLKLDYRTLPRSYTTTTSRECLRRKCPFFGSACYVHGARKKAESADIVVTNHSLLFCDLVAGGGLLPPIRYWVLDEAHGAESEARKAFSVELAADELLRIISKVSSEEPSRNAFLKVERRIAVKPEGENHTLLFGLLAKAKSVGSEFSGAAKDIVEQMRSLLYFDANKRSKVYDSVDLWLNEDIRRSETFAALRGYADVFEKKTTELVKACQDLVAVLEEYDGIAESQREIAALALTLKDTIAASEIIFGASDEKYVYSATLSKKNDRPRDVLRAQLLNIGTALENTLYERAHSVVFASATLTVGDSFDSFNSSMGLGGTTHPCNTLKLDSSYDYDAHMTVYVVEDMPEPNESAYLDSLSEFLVEVHRAQHGSVLTLFTNRREMEKCYADVQPELKKDDLRVVCQKWGTSPKGLRDDFLSDEHLSLFALKSFWEGFDAPGATLKAVVIPKLPFARPTDPLSCERAARDDAAWRHYVLPAAVIETKQAAGRLIRTSTDEGCLILADKRLVTKGYGKSFLKSMPSKTIKIMKRSEIVEDIERAMAQSPSIEAESSDVSEAVGR